MNKKVKAVSTLISVILLVVVATIIAIGVLNWGNQFTNKNLDRTDGILDTRKHIENQIIVNSFVAATSEKIGHLSIKNLGPNDVTINGYTISDNEGNIQEITLDSEIEIVTGASVIIPITTILTGTKVLIVLNNPNNYFSLSSITKAPQERPKVLTPTSNLLSGEVPYLSEVNLSTLTNGAIIRYTVDETEPTEESLIFLDPIVITNNLTLKAKAFLSGWTASDTVTFNYQVLTTGNPVASLESGYVPLETEIILIPDNENDIIFYTTDGTDPTDLSNLYDSSPILIQEDTTLKLIAMRNDYKNSDIVTYEYLIDGPKQLALGENHSCVVLNGGKINCWGENVRWQLGDGTSNNSNVPILVSNITDAIEVAIGYMHSCAISGNGQVMCWGDNKSGQLGLEKATEYSEIPAAVPGISEVKSIIVGGNSTCAIKDNADLYCWGDNKYGQLGTGGTADVFVPTKILENIADVDIGINHTCAIDLGNQLYCWGENQFGQLGDTTQNSSTLPVSIGSDFKNVKVGENHTCAIKLNNDLYCWGDNQYGQLGPIDPIMLVPTKIYENVISMDLGNNHSCLIQEKSGKDIIQACWGRNDFSQLTLPRDNDPHYTSEALKNIVNIHSTSLGGNHVCSLVNNTKNSFKEIYCWGNNSSGQIGIGSEDAIIETESNVTQIMYSEKK